MVFDYEQWIGSGKLTPTEVVAYFDADPMPCLVCGRKFQLLGRHITPMHGMLVEEYCEEFGIPFVWKGHTGLATMAQRQRMSDNTPDDHREFVRHIHKLSPQKPPPAVKRRAVWKVVRHALSGVADRRCRQCDKVYTPSSSGNKGWCTIQCASRRPGLERPWQVTGPSPCANCGKIYKPLRRGRCNACRLYFGKYGTERLSPQVP
jgi:hypothetical protein